MEKKTLALCFFLFLLAAQEMVVMRTEARTCESLSDTFSGYCGRTSDCHYHCQKKEHFLSGRCKFTSVLNSQCFCTRNC